MADRAVEFGHEKHQSRLSLYLLDGTRASYTYKGDNAVKLYTLIAHDGPVRIRCMAYMDENLKPTSVDIYDLERIQDDLFPHPDLESPAAPPEDE